MSVAAHKHYLADKKPFYRHFQHPYVSLTALKSFAIVGAYSLVVSTPQKKSEDDDDSDSDDSDDSDEAAQKESESTADGKIVTKKIKEEDEPTPLSFNDYAVLYVTHFATSLSYTTCLRTLENIAITHFRPRIVDKLIKDVGKSAVRKAMRTGSNATASLLMLKTGVRANVLSYFAIFLVDATTSTTAAFVRSYRKLRKKEAKKLLRHGNDENVTADSRLTSGIIASVYALGVFLRLTSNNARIMSRAIIGGAVGAAVGTLVRPGVGTVVGAHIGEGLIYVF